MRRWCASADKQLGGAKLENGASAEIAIVGNESVVGISLFMGGGTTPSRAVVKSAGGGWRLPGELFKQEFDRLLPELPARCSD